MNRRCRFLNFFGQRGPASSPLLTGLIENYKLADTTGVNGNTLTNNNGVTFTTGKVGNCASFTGASSQYLSRAAQVWGFGNAWTIALWYKLNAAADDQNLFQFGANLATPSASAFKIVSNYLYFADSSAVIFKHWSGIPKSTNWTHLAATWDGSSLVIYQNGSDISAGLTKTTNNAGTMANGSRQLIIGAADNGGARSDYLDGLIDAMDIASRAWSASEVALSYNSAAGREHPYT